jgi:hypothetical protein
MIAVAEIVARTRRQRRGGVAVVAVVKRERGEFEIEAVVRRGNGDAARVGVDGGGEVGNRVWENAGVRGIRRRTVR